METAEKSDKTELIIETAQRRFGIYGVEKTSMREIANDLNLSKASLYYYFPDKESLYKAVIEKEQHEFITDVSDKLLSIRHPEKILLEYVSIRLIYFRKLLNLSRMRYEAFSDLRPAFRTSLESFREKEEEIIIKILDKGVSSGIFAKMNSSKAASLFLDILKGLRMSVVTDKTTLIIENDEFEKLLEKTLDFTRIFIKGIKPKNSNINN